MKKRNRQKRDYCSDHVSSVSNQFSDARLKWLLLIILVCAPVTRTCIGQPHKSKVPLFGIGGGNCIEIHINPFNWRDYVFPWDSVMTRQIYFRNILPKSVQIDSVIADSSTPKHLHILPRTFPILLGPWATDSVAFEGQSSQFQFSYDSAKGEWSTVVHKWWVYESGSDTSGVSCPADTVSDFFASLNELWHEPFNLPHHAYPVAVGLRVGMNIAALYNTQSPFTVDSIWVETTRPQELRLLHIDTANHRTIATGDSLLAYVALGYDMNPDSIIPCTGTLLLRHSDGFRDTVKLEAWWDQVQGVVESPARLFIYPNPTTAQFSMSVEHVQTSELTISDILGHTVAHLSGIRNGEMRSDALREQLSRGTYIIRLEGYDDRQQPFVISKKLEVR